MANDSLSNYQFRGENICCTDISTICDQGFTVILGILNLHCCIYIILKSLFVLKIIHDLVF